MNFLIFLILIVNGIIVFFFLQFISYGIFSYYFFWKKRAKLNLSLDKLNKLSKQKNVELPKITILVPARNESYVISSTIDNFMNMNYPKDKFNILLVLDDKEKVETPYEQTTHYFVEYQAIKYNTKFKQQIVLSTSVPINFDGKYNGIILDNIVNSSKPRALNWALSKLNPDTQIIGIYDADSRPDPDTFLYIAYKFITEPDKPILLQGPAVQVRNYFNIKLLNKIYALTQAITHEWFMPVLLFQLPFIGGTNFFIKSNLVLQINGFNEEALSEDLEFGCRLYLEKNVWPEFLPYISTEQTPPNFSSFFHQRVRWASGYMQVIKNMLVEKKYLKKRFFLFSMLVFYGILPWIATQILSISTLGILLVSFLGLSHIFDLFPEILKILFVIMNFVYLLFLIIYFRHALRKLYIQQKITNVYFYKIKQYSDLLIFPVAAIFGSLPYTYGFITTLFSNGPTKWVKTVRSKE